MDIKKTVSLCLALFVLLFLSGCDSQPKDSGSGETEDVSAQVPTEAEIQTMLENGEIKVLWAVEEDAFSQSSAVSVYRTESVDGDAVWNALFSQNDLVSRQQFNEYSDMLITLDGTEYSGRLYNTGLIEFSGLPEFPTALSPENVMNALSGFTGMNWTLSEPDDAADTSTYYQFSVEGIIIDRNGYSVGEEVYTGPFVLFDSSYVAICIRIRLGEKGEALVPTDFVSSEQAKTLCSADFLAQCDFPMIIVFDHAELVYYYQAQQQMLLPAWRITGTFYDLSDDGTLFSGPTARLIDAQSGELFW